MSVSPWLVLRQAQEAVDAGRPDDAHRQLEPLLSEGNRRAVRLAREVVRGYTARALKALDQHNPDAAWRDLLAAEALNTGEKAVAELRYTLARLSVVQAKAMLEAGRPIDTLDQIARLRDRGVRHPDLERLEAAAQDWVHSSELADRGEFLRALSEVDRIFPKLPCPPTGLERFRCEVEARHARFRDAVARLMDAAEAKRWAAAVAVAAEVLSVAPDHREAKAVRGRAWAVVAPETVSPAGPLPVPELPTMRPAARSTSGHALATRAESARPPSGPLIRITSGESRAAPGGAGLSTSAGPALPKRFLLWVDGVGGYLVCLSNRVTFGQATADGPVDVPLYADVSRTHAELTRDPEGYVIESGRAVRVNGAETKRAVLAPGDRVTLGTSCQFLFHKPVSASSSAKLEVTSGHRLQTPVEAVLLMGNELILGPEPDSHIPLEVEAPVLIYRSREGLSVRVPDTRFTLDDRPCEDRALLTLPGVVSCDQFTFAVEPVSGRL
ncbi:MAG TPA: FHA domain-containing protein [Gemmata sp.]